MHNLYGKKTHKVQEARDISFLCRSMPNSAFLYFMSIYLFVPKSFMCKHSKCGLREVCSLKIYFPPLCSLFLKVFKARLAMRRCANITLPLNVMTRPLPKGLSAAFVILTNHVMAFTAKPEDFAVRKGPDKSRNKAR